jgi:hypothetical protein
LFDCLRVHPPPSAIFMQSFFSPRSCPLLPASKKKRKKKTASGGLSLSGRQDSQPITLKAMAGTARDYFEDTYRVRLEAQHAKPFTMMNNESIYHFFLRRPTVFFCVVQS